MISSSPPALPSASPRRAGPETTGRPPKPRRTPARLRATVALPALALLLLSLPLLAGHLHERRLSFLTGLALAAAFLPATGPRGRHIRVSNGVGLASLLLLLPGLAALPVLIGGVTFAATRQTRTARREALAEAVSMGLAALVGGILYHRAAGSVFSLPAGLVAFGVYALIALGGRAAWVRSARRDWVLEIMGLAASVTPALLMARLWPDMGVPGLWVSALLLALLVVVAHFGFEASLLREQVRAMERLGAVTLAQDNMARLITRFLQLGGGLVSAHRMAVWLTDDADFRLERVARLQADWAEADGNRTQIVLTGPTEVRLGEGLVGRVAERQLPLIVRDGSCESRAAEAERRDWPETSFSLLLLPLVVGGQTVGVAQFERDDPQPYTRRDLDRVRALAGQAAAAIVNGRRHQDMTTQAVTDGLTGLFNRRHMQSCLDSEQRRALRYGHTLSVIMLDIDHFKSYNDTYGHTQGDVVIKMVASLLRANVRSVDIVGRYGGEEFVILMPETTKEEAGFTAERLRQSVAAAVFPGFADDPEMAVLKTISLGLATMPQDAANGEMLVVMADQALYEAKRGGRNQVALA